LRCSLQLVLEPLRQCVHAAATAGSQWFSAEHLSEFQCRAEGIFRSEDLDVHRMTMRRDLDTALNVLQDFNKLHGEAAWRTATAQAPRNDTVCGDDRAELHSQSLRWA
jgi:hypothetical protein